jgi:4-hydroxy-3-polyprenylbenzoate decarboxylase
MVVQAETLDATAGARWDSMRQWLDLVDAIGELKVIRGASSEEDIGAITEMVEHHDGSPCVLFDDIPGFQPGYRVLSNSMGTRARQAITLGLDPATATHARLLGHWRGLLKGFTPIPPTVVPRGPIQENVIRDDDVDLSR